MIRVVKQDPRIFFFLYACISLVFLFIPVFINFDSHHDGLILSTTLELKRSLEDGGEWPFNQYGQIWAFPFAFLSLFVSDQHLFLSIRLLTFLYYIVTAYLIHKISARFLHGLKAQAPGLLFLLAQPFALGLNSTFLPWPSAFTVLLITAALERLTSESKTHLVSNVSFFSTGVIFLGILGTRFQVGLILLFSVTILLILHKRVSSGAYLLFGFISSLGLMGVYLQSQGWLRDSLFDSIVFSSQYVLGDTSTYPIPIVTIFLSLFFIILLASIDRIARRGGFTIALTSRSFLFLSAAIASLVLSLSIFSNLSLTDWVTLLIRRTWISASIAMSVYAFFALVVTSLLRGTLFRDSSYRRNILVLLSLCSFTQIVPLFDQMHFWWGFSPLVILFVYVIQERLLKPQTLMIPLRSAFVLLTSFALIMNMFGVFRQVESVKEMMDPAIGSAVYLNDSTDNAISIFLNKNVNPGSAVLSLCPNSNAIFSLKSSRSAIREFVLWSPTFSFSKYRNSFLSADFDFIVSCPMVNPGDIGQQKINASIFRIVDEFDVKKVDSFVDAHGREWFIYKIDE